MYSLTKVLVLKSQFHKEHDKLSTVYSYEYGKMQVIVPGAKKIAAKLASATEPITESEFIIHRNHPILRPTVTGGVILKNFIEIKTNFKKNLYALYVAEIVDSLLPFNLENSDKYKLILRILEVISTCQNVKLALCAFTLRFLKLSGYSFFDYLKSVDTFISQKTFQHIRELSNCKGSDIDLFEGINAKQVWNYIENYLTNYMRRPCLSIFLAKMEYLGYN
ncbi:MAG: DNA repair protein RecO [Elusimicrobiota bacterium]|jgi:DNA repair protein RecO (recombination protein O)|nr:DNA repair protein RecO [Elusimicrobiota bacterium]